MVEISISSIVYILFTIYGFTITDAAKRAASKPGKGGGTKSISNPTTPGSKLSKDWYTCDFESGYCGWQNDTTADFEWYRTSKETPTGETGPRWDHTKPGETDAGYYLYIETSVPRKNGDHARIISPTLWEVGPFCFRFWHNMHGSDVKDLNVKVRGLTSKREVTVSHLSGPWSVGSNKRRLSGENTDWWNQESIDIMVDEPINIIIEGISGKNYKGDIAVDDFELQKGKCPRQSANCDFENNTCGWSQMADDEFNWLPNRGMTQTMKTGPDHDHTFKSAHGRYLYIETSWPRVEGDKARLLSPKISCDIGAMPVFNFWYNMNGAHTGPLKVYIGNDKMRLGDAVWEKNGDHGKNWFLGQVKIFRAVLDKGAFYIIIEAERKNFEGDIAIDDLSIAGCRSGEEGFGNLNILTTTKPITTTSETRAPTQSGRHVMLPPSLPDKINCDFENNICGWQQASNDDTNWIRSNKKTPSTHTGPAVDHTTGHGSFIYFESSSPRRRGDFVVIRSNAINPLMQVCVSFYYHMNGRTMGSLELLTAKRGGTRYQRKWMKQGQQSKNDRDWQLAQVTIRESEPYQLAFRATRGNGFYSDIALDDIEVRPYPCDNQDSPKDTKLANVQPTFAGTTAIPRHPAACDFGTQSLCQWKQVSSRNDDFDWTIASSNTDISNYTGPAEDHTSGSRGNYIYIEASVPYKNPGDSAKLMSVPFKVDKPQCFRFWYHMYGTGIGHLTIYNMVKKRLLPLWSNGGEKGNSWFEGMIDLPISKNTELVVEAKRGSEWSGDIALDDFDVTDGKCPTIDCDFEADNCGWVQEDGNDEFNWTRNSGPTKSRNTGPSYDHTTKRTTGTYLYIEASNKQRYDTAWIRSPIIDPKFNSAKCLTFWYHSFGENVGSINVHKILPNSNTKYFGSALWLNTKNQGNQWVFAKVNIRDPLPYQIIIQGIVGLDYLGDVAIDDIELKDGPCGTCCDKSNRFKCGNNYCIHKAYRCNGVDDCGDESDESFCENALQPACGMPFESPPVREVPDATDDIQRDETVFETFAVPEEGVGQTAASNDTWKGALKIPFAQASQLKHPRFVASPRAPIDIAYFADDMLFNILDGYRSEKISDKRKKRSAADFDDGDNDDWVDIIKLQELQNEAKTMEKNSMTLAEYKFAETKKAVAESFGHAHKIEGNDWEMLRGKKTSYKQINRAKRSIKKIIGGSRTSRLNYPWQVAYYITDSSTNSHFFCGGTLFDRYWILTAAHCPYLGDLHNIVLGDYDLYKDEGTEQEMLVDAIYLRNKFRVNKEMVDDIALIKLRYPAKQSKSVQLACLLRDGEKPFAEGHPCVATGWGRTNSDTPGIERYLRQTEMPIISNSECKSAFWSSFKIPNSYICAGGTGGNSCKGDSGGPLVCKKDDLFYLAGITSWGDTRCTASIPGVFTRVQSYNEWIHRIMKKTDDCSSQ